MNDTDYVISFRDELGDTVEAMVVAGESFDFTAITAGGVSEFLVSEIDVAEMLNPTDPTAFVTVVTTSGSGVVTITQTPIAMSLS